jgi:hypothetical protein
LGAKASARQVDYMPDLALSLRFHLVDLP